MKKVESCDNLERMSKKRKLRDAPLGCFACSAQSKDKRQATRNLSIDTNFYLYCDICNDIVINYKYCIGYYIYCSLECYSILVLRIMNNTQHHTFNDA